MRGRDYQAAALRPMRDAVCVDRGRDYQARVCVQGDKQHWVAVSVPSVRRKRVRRRCMCKLTQIGYSVEYTVSSVHRTLYLVYMSQTKTGTTAHTVTQSPGLRAGNICQIRGVLPLRTGGESGSPTRHASGRTGGSTRWPMAITPSARCCARALSNTPFRSRSSSPAATVRPV